YLLRHPAKAVWFIHHHRGAFDLVGTPFQDVPDGPRGTALREMFRSADDVALREARRVFTNSAEMSDRVRRYNRLDVPVLYPPLPADGRAYRCSGYGDALLYVARMAAVKRQHLAIHAL